MSVPTPSHETPFREVDSLFRTVFENAAVGLAVLDGEGRFLEANARFHHMLERGADRLLGSTFEAIAHPDDALTIKRLVDDVVRGRRREFSRDARFLRGDTQFLWVKMQVTALRLKDVRMMAVIEDIDARKQAEQELLEQERMFREMLDALPAAIYTTDASGAVTHFNRAAATFAGHEPRVGDPWCVTWRLHYPDGRPMPHNESPMAVALREGREVFGEEAIAVRPDGSRVWFMPYPVPLRDEHGDVVGGINMLVDITERKRIEEDLRRHRDNLRDLVEERTREVLEANARARHTERMAVIGTLSAGLGHDMANLLVPVQIRLEALSRMDLPDAVNEHLAAIRNSAVSLQQLSGGLRLLAAEPAGRARPTELGAWWEDSGRILRTVLPGSVSLEADLPATPVWVNMPKTALLQAVFNLVQNSADALRERTDGRVIVKAEADDRHVLIRVSDNGPGMSAEVLRRCFEPFFTTKHRSISTGLGLSIVYGLVKEAGGEIEIRSEPGAGTAFVLRLERGTDPDELEAQRSRRIAQVTVGDDRLRAIFDLELRALGYEVVGAAVDEVRPEVVVTDRAHDVPREGKLVFLADGPDRPASAVALGSKPSVQAIRNALARIAATGAKEGRP